MQNKFVRWLPVVFITSAVLSVATPAWGHVVVSPTSAPQGTNTVLTFQVPDEMDNANTTQVQIFFPANEPIADATVQPIAGWNVNVAKKNISKPIQTDDGPATQIVSSITWTGGTVQPGQFLQFYISVGLPNSGHEMVFKTLQTYSNGQIVRWIESTPKNGPEPEHPAPTLVLTSTVHVTVGRSTDDHVARDLAIAAIALGGVDILASLVFVTMRRRRNSTSS